MWVNRPKLTPPLTRWMMLSITVFVIGGLPCRADVALTCLDLNRNAPAVSQLLADGNTAFEAGKTSEAEASWLKIHQCAAGSSDWPKAVYNLGLLEYKRDNPRQAITYFDEVLQSRPNDKEPGGNIMQTNRNYSFRSAMAISQCYEGMGAFRSALHYAWLAKTKYGYYSWCGTCYNNANFAVNKRIAYLTLRATRVHIWASALLLGFITARWKKSRNGKRNSGSQPGGEM